MINDNIGTFNEGGAGSVVAGSVVAGSVVAGSVVAGSVVAGSVAGSVVGSVGSGLPGTRSRNGGVGVIQMSQLHQKSKQMNESGAAVVGTGSVDEGTTVVGGSVTETSVGGGSVVDGSTVSVATSIGGSVGS